MDLSGNRRGTPVAQISGMTLRSWILAAAVVAPTAAPTAAVAAPTVIELAEGFGGPEDEKGGAGNEQPSVAVVDKEGKRFVVSHDPATYDVLTKRVSDAE